ncbi:hypothetical protein NSPZN2_30037 [Nitrospira defluvii]|uniref:Uncharacterized protein n=1 Tax=Nitrospira defluvii TaxID=330214 RepID=A0ABM8REJ4_9BACT|nr:hypothetical protein NSPZN2_30037 [Nitrospira defluvii]
MTVRRELAKPRRETGARSREDPRHTRAVRRGAEGASPPAAGLSEQRVGECSRSVHEQCGLGGLRQFAPDIGQLALDRHPDFRDGQTKFIRLAPAYRGRVDENRVGAISWENTQLHFGANGDGNRAENSTPPWRQVSQIPISGQHLSLHREVAAKLHAHTLMLTLIFHREAASTPACFRLLRITRTIGQNRSKDQHCLFLHHTVPRPATQLFQTCATTRRVAPMIHAGSSRNLAVTMRDRREEPLGVNLG